MDILSDVNHNIHLEKLQIWQ